LTCIIIRIGNSFGQEWGCQSFLIQNDSKHASITFLESCLFMLSSPQASQGGSALYDNVWRVCVSDDGVRETLSSDFERYFCKA
jgi:hypothetical protein